MIPSRILPRLLVFDDLFGRTVSGGRNEERANLCGQYLLEDVTGDESGPAQRIKQPIAQVVFHRAQRPTCARIGDVVENDLAGALEVVRSGWGATRGDQPCWSLVLVDLCFYTGKVTEESNGEATGMPEGRSGDGDSRTYFGMQLLEMLHRETPDLPVILLSSHSRDDVSREFSRRGALGFLPRVADESPARLREYIWRHGLIPDDSGRIVGRAPALLLALRAARRASTGRRHVLLRGERGSGKEVLARYLHGQNSRLGEPGWPLVIVNSASLSRELYASTLFGHQKGAFTGALTDRTGAVMRANGGDLFLDEIGSMPPEVQAGVLRVLEYGEVEPVGADVMAKVDARFLSATNEEIEARAAWGEFRSDLLDRLRMGGTIFVPPLRERLEDLPLLVEQFVRDAESKTPGAMRRQIDPEAMQKLRAHHWPGNVRELDVCIADAVRENPDVEYLVPVHLRIAAGPVAPTARGTKPETLESRSPEPPADPAAKVVSIDDLEDLLESVDFDRDNFQKLGGKLAILQTCCAKLMARYLKFALEMTARTSTGRDGAVQREVLIHPAGKFMSGDSTLTAAQAADIIKRIFRQLEGMDDALLNDPLLQDAISNALNLRPKKPRTTKGK